jgi:hypothetical protein
MKLGPTSTFRITGFVLCSYSCALKIGEHNLSVTAYFPSSRGGETRTLLNQLEELTSVPAHNICQSLSVRNPSGTRNQFLFLLEIFGLQVCYFVAPSLTRGRVCNLLFLLVLASKYRSSLSPAGLKTIFYCPNS